MTEPLAGRGPAAVHVVGRDAELSAIRECIAAGTGASALVLAGSPGIGKTTLYDAAIDTAHGSGHRVLAARASSTESPAPFAALIDLCDGIDEAAMADLPEPQRTALDVALVRARPGDTPPNARAIALGFRAAVRSLSRRVPTLIAIDDVQWLDPSSLDVLAFLAHRLRDEDVRVVMTRSTERPTAVESAFERSHLRCIEIGPLSFGAVRRLLLDRLELSLSRPMLHRVVAVTQANPLFVLELGRELLARGIPASAEALPIPAQIEDLFTTRIAELPAAARRALMALALFPEIELEELAAIAGQAALDEIVDRELAWVAGHRVRAAHPLLGATALRGLGQRDRRELHLALAAAIADPEQQAVHLALGTPGRDDALAATVAAAAERAAARGARQQAVLLAGHALRITPAQSAGRGDRVLALAEYLETAGEMQRLTDLLSAELDGLPAGRTRAWALLMLSEGVGSRRMDDLTELQRRALAEDPDDPILRARVLAKKASNAAASLIVDIAQAHAWASEAVALTREARPDARRSGLYALAWARAMSGNPVDDLCQVSRATTDGNAYIAVTPERVAGQRHVWRGEIPAARETLGRLLTIADEQGEIESYALMRLHMCELHLRVGEWAAASELLDEWAESADRTLMFRPKYERCRALLAAGRGDRAETREWSALAIDRGRQTGSRWDELEGQRAAAMGSLLAHEPADAVAGLLPVWRYLEAEGVTEPGVFPIAPDLVQALVETDELSEAKVVADRLAHLARSAEHPWAAATATRCRALVDLVGNGDDAAARRLEGAAATYHDLGLTFDAARCLLSLGRAQRRRRQWGSARAATEQAVAWFDAIGSTGWAADARGETERMGARGSHADGQLTASEQRAASLAAAGLSNKEIARELVVTVHTVEVHLSRVYAKLGLRSRGQLAAHLNA